MSVELRKELNELVKELENERVSFISHWTELSNNILPRRAQFTLKDSNKGDKRNTTIKDETVVLASRTLRAGLMGGITSPARPWFKLGSSDQTLNSMPAVQEWLHDTTKRMAGVFLRSNLYKVLPTIYGDLGTFGSGAMGIEEHLGGKTVRFNSFPIGSYSVAMDDDFRPVVFARELSLTARQIVMRFAQQTDGKYDFSNISQTITDAWKEKRNLGNKVEVYHVIRPNPNWDPNKQLSFKYESVYFEKSSPENKILRKKGYHYFPILFPRWEVTGEDVYGTNCPGMESLASIKQLHKMEMRAIQAVEKMVNPAMKAPTSLKTQKVSTIPGDITYVDDRDGAMSLSPVYDIRYNLEPHEVKMNQVRDRIKRAFFEDLFFMFTNMAERERVTAAEIYEKKEEKLIMLGPTLEQLNQDLFDPLIDITFMMMYEQGELLPPPPELEGTDLKVEYVSVMHQAQKLVSLGGIDRLKQHAAEVAQLDPQSLDKFDLDKLTDEYSDVLGVPPGLVRNQEDVMQIRKARAEQAAAAEAAESARENAASMANLSQALGPDKMKQMTEAV